MFNVLLDPLPTEYKGFPIDSDFQIGIQIMQALEDGKLSRQEGQAVALCSRKSASPAGCRNCPGRSCVVFDRLEP